MPKPVPPKKLCIWQQNINGSLDSQHDLLISLKTNYDLCLIQEPYIDNFGASRANSHWSVLYPAKHSTDPKSTRSVILVRASIPTDSWTRIDLPTPDITGIEMRGEYGTLQILNIYNNCTNNNSLQHVRDYMARPKVPVERRPQHTLWMGDFN